MKLSAKKITLCGLFAGLCAVGTIMIAFPLPATNGYINLGDVFVMASALLLGPVLGGISGGVGSAFGDILLGYPHFALFTFVIKFLEGFVVGFIYLKVINSKKWKDATQILAFLLGALIMAVGYFFAAALLYGFPAAILDLPANFAQGGVAVVCVTVFYKTVFPAVSGFVQNRLNRKNQ